MKSTLKVTPTNDTDPRTVGLELTTEVGEWRLERGKLLVTVDCLGDQETMMRRCNTHPGVAHWQFFGPAIGERLN